MNGLRSDMKQGWRMLWHAPGVALIAILTLALGIGANTAVFSVVNAVLLRQLPYPQPQRLAGVWETNRASHRIQISGWDVLDWQRDSRSFQRMAAYSGFPMAFSHGQTAVRVPAALTGKGFFQILGASPMLGRRFLPTEHQPGHDVAVIGYGLWQSAFGGQASALGKQIRLEGKPFTVVGVMPPGVSFPQKAQVWVPLEILGTIQSYGSRSAHNFDVIGRLKTGVTVAQAKSEMAAIAAHLAQLYPNSNTHIGATVIGLRRQLAGSAGPALLILLGAVGFVLLIACANIGNLLLARAVSHSREISVRMALGATRAAVMKQFLSESLLLAAMGGGLGLLLCFWGVHALNRLAPASITALGHFSVDGRVLAFTFAVTLLTGLLSGLGPAWRMAGEDPGEALKQSGSRAGLSSGSRRLQNLLVVGEIALSLVLLAGAGLLARSFLNIEAVPLGFHAGHVLRANLALPTESPDYSNQGQVTGFYDQVLEQTRALPGVTSAAVTSEVPMEAGNTDGGFVIEGRPPVSDYKMPYANYRIISPGYFKTLGIPLRRGRALTTADQATTPEVVVINQALAQRNWPGQNPIGQRMKFLGFDRHPQWMQVVGVVGDMRDVSVASRPLPEAYVPYTQHWQGALNSGLELVAKTSARPTLMAPAVRALVRRIAPDVPVETTSLRAMLAATTAPARFYAVVLSVFAGLALLLAAAGIYGVMAWSVARRTGEIGVRMALGARRQDVLRLVLRQGLGLASIGVAVGAAAALGLTRLLASLLYGVQPTDAATFAAVALALLALALLASYIPARRATRVDPLQALRAE